MKTRRIRQTEKDLKKIFQPLTELQMPDKEKILAACQEKAPLPSPQKTKAICRHSWGKRATLRLALVAAMLLLLTVSVFAVQSEWQRTKSFFEKYDLVSESLSRREMIRVYRDIVTEKFSYGKTAEVFCRSAVEIKLSAEEWTPEKLAALWHDNLSYHFDVSLSAGDGQEYCTTRDAVYCYHFDALMWTKEMSGYTIENAALAGDGVMIWGGRYENVRPGISFLARLDSKGKILWIHEFLEPASFTRSTVDTAFFDERDDTVTVFLYTADRVVGAPRTRIYRFDANGQILSETSEKFGWRAVSLAVSFEDGMLIRLEGDLSEDDEILRLDREGNVLESLHFTAADGRSAYYVTDFAFAKAEGLLYLSAYEAPTSASGEYYGKLAEVAEVLTHLQGKDYTEEEAAALLRENYTAVLLLCRVDSWEVEGIFSVTGALGGALSTDKNEIVWSVQLPLTARLTHEKEDTIRGDCAVMQYTFDRTGQPLEHSETGKTAIYRR